MKLVFPQLECSLTIDRSAVSTLQVEDRKTFSRVVASLESEAGEEADEPYALLGDKDRRLPSRKAMLFVDALPSVPLSDRTLLAKLNKRMARELEMDSERYARIQELSARLGSEIESVAERLWGDYSVCSDWDFDAYLKVFGFAPLLGECDGLLDKCIRFIDLCSDIEERRPLVFVNAKSFFSREELEELFGRVVFSGIQALFLESWHDTDIYENERKVVIDQQFYVG